jgi:signal peptidase
MRSRRITSALRLAGAAGLAVLVALGALMLVPPLLGYERYVIEGGSMAGALPRGAIAYERLVPVDRLSTGDVITYTHAGSRITHRIVSITRDPAGRRVFRTKGDANAAPDPWRFTLPSARQPVVRFHVPLVGYVIAALSVRVLRMLLIGLPALAIGLLLLRGVWRDHRAAGAGAAAQ